MRQLLGRNEQYATVNPENQSDDTCTYNKQANNMTAAVVDAAAAATTITTVMTNKHPLSSLSHNHD